MEATEVSGGDAADSSELGAGDRACGRLCSTRPAWLWANHIVPLDSHLPSLPGGKGNPAHSRGSRTQEEAKRGEGSVASKL